MARSLAEFEFLVMLAALRLGPDEAYTVSIAADSGAIRTMIGDLSELVGEAG